MKKKRIRSRQDITVRDRRALNKRIKGLEDRLRRIEGRIFSKSEIESRRK